MCQNFVEVVQGPRPMNAQDDVMGPCQYQSAVRPMVAPVQCGEDDAGSYNKHKIVIPLLLGRKRVVISNWSGDIDDATKAHPRRPSML